MCLLDSVLRNRWASVLAPLLALAGVGSRQATVGFSKDQMLDRLQSLVSTLSLTYQPLLGSHQTANQKPHGLAAIISQQKTIFDDIEHQS